jgi:hypothetical protein
MLSMSMLAELPMKSWITPSSSTKRRRRKGRSGSRAPGVDSRRAVEAS